MLQDSGEKLFVCSGMMLNEKHEALFVQRGLKGDRPDLWELPGGKVQERETYGSALVREWEEELGVQVEVVGTICTVDLHLEVPFTCRISHVRHVSGSFRLLADQQNVRWETPLYAVQKIACMPSFYVGYKYITSYIERHFR